MNEKMAAYKSMPRSMASIPRELALVCPEEKSSENSEPDFDEQIETLKMVTNTLSMQIEAGELKWSRKAGEGMDNDINQQVHNGEAQQELDEKVVRPMEALFERFHQQNQGLRNKMIEIERKNMDNNTSMASQDRHSLQMFVRTLEEDKRHLKETMSVLEYSNKVDVGQLPIVRGMIQDQMVKMGTILQQKAVVENEKVQSDEMLKRMQSAMKERDQSLKKLETKYQELQCVNQKLTADSHRLIFESNVHDAEMEDIRKVNESLQKEIELQSHEIQDLHDENRCIKEENVNIKAIHKGMMDDNEKLKMKLEEEQLKISSVFKERQKQAEAAEHICEHHQKLKGEIIEIQKQNLADARMAARKKKALQLELSAFTEEILKLKSENATLSELLRASEKLAADFQAKLVHQEVRNQEKGHDLEQEKTILEEKIDEQARIGRNVIAELTRGGTELRNGLDKCQNEMKFWRSGAQQLKHHLHAQQKVITKLQSERERKFAQKNKEMVRVHLKYDKLLQQRKSEEKEMEALKTQNDTITNRNQALQKQLRDQRGIIRNLQLRANAAFEMADGQRGAKMTRLQTIRNLKMRAKEAFTLIQQFRFECVQLENESMSWRERAMEIQQQWKYSEGKKLEEQQSEHESTLQRSRVNFAELVKATKEQKSEIRRTVDEVNQKWEATLQGEKVKIMELQRVNHEHQEIHKKMQSDHWEQMRVVKGDMAKLIHLLEEERRINAMLVQGKDAKRESASKESNQAESDEDNDVLFV